MPDQPEDLVELVGKTCQIPLELPGFEQYLSIPSYILEPLIQGHKRSQTVF